MPWLLILFVLFFGNLFSDDDIEGYLPTDARPLFVSLGSHCEVSGYLRENHLRLAAFPFDWLLTLNHDRFINLLDNDFHFFLDEQCFIQHPNHPYVIENYYYQIEFRHDWPFSDSWTNPDRYRQQIEEIKEKYQRRITRFRQLANYPGKVIFIRAAYEFLNDPNPLWGESSQAKINSEQVQTLKQALDRFFPLLDYLLVIINYKEERAPDIQGIEKVMEFKIRKSHKSLDYTNMFNKISKQDF